MTDTTITNSQMSERRFERWAIARRKLRSIVAHLEANGTVYVCTMTRATKYTTKHAGMFKATRSGLYVQRGKHWDCIDYCGIKMV